MPLPLIELRVFGLPVPEREIQPFGQMPRRVREEGLGVGRREIRTMDEVQLRVIEVDLTDVLRLALIDVVRAGRVVEPLVQRDAREAEFVRGVLVIEALRTAVVMEWRAVRVVREYVVVLAHRRDPLQRQVVGEVPVELHG